MRKSRMKAILVLGILFATVLLTSCMKFTPLDKDVRDEIKQDKLEQSIHEPLEETQRDSTINEEDVQGEATEQKPSDAIENNEAIAEGASEEDHFDYAIDSSELSSEPFSWSFKRNSNHEPVIGYSQGIDLAKYDAFYRVDTDEKVIYLTFDEGYENGYTSRILDILKENDVQAAFFVTKPYIDSNPELCIRMVEEGHVVGNHSVTHSSFPTLTNTQIKEELEGTANVFKEITGYEMDPFFRTPSGNYSESVLNEVRKNGYYSIFWSLAYKDWDVNNQPGKDFVYNHILENHHPGGIFLLHAVSESNTEALDSVLKALKQEGYRFGNLYELK